MKKKSKGYNKNATPKKVKENPKFELLRKEILTLKDNEDYEEAMLKIVELFDTGYNDIDIMYELAEIYYLTNDYERAATWVGKILGVNNSHQETLLLAIKIYNNSGQSEKTLPIIELLLSRSDDKFINENKEFFSGIINVNKDQIDQFKLISKFITADNIVLNETSVRITSNEVDFCINSYLTKILKQEQIADKEVDIAINQEKEVVAEAIMAYQTSLVNKIALYNYFSYAKFKLDALTDSIYYLKQSLLIDDQNDLVLKNLGFVLSKNNEQSAAKEYLQKVQNKDFMVLDLL